MNTWPNQANLPVIVFFDGGCGLCSREIRLLRRFDLHRQVQWIDINLDMSLLNAFGIDYRQAMRRFHVLDPAGVLRVGAPAFVALWSVLPLFSLLARLIHLTRTVEMLDKVYEQFAERRFRARLRCSTCKFGDRPVLISQSKPHHLRG